MPEYPPVTVSLTTLRAWMAEHASGISFRPPAKPAALENFAEQSGLTLPDDLRRLLLAANGEARSSAGAVGNWRVMPIAEIQAAWGWLNSLAVKGAFSEGSPLPSPYLRAAWWHPGWVPVISNDRGDYFCLDTDPLEPERFGQVLLFLQDRPERPLVAASLVAWLARITQDLAAGVYTFDEIAGFDGEAFLWSSLEGKHLLDDIQGKLVTQDNP